MTVTINGTTGVTTPGVTNSGNETIAGTLQVGGVTTNVYPLVSGTSVASTSGTSIDFTSIPSWVKRITVMFNGVSLNGSSDFLIQLGDAGGIETTGYVSTGNFYNGSNQTDALSSTSGFIINTSTSSSLASGHAIITLISSNTWISSHNTVITTTAVGNGGGSKTLSDTLTQIRITTVNGTDTFDAGSINILYE